MLVGGACLLRHRCGLELMLSRMLQARQAARVRDKPGRESDAERILAYNIGISLHDTFFASKVYELAADSSPTVDLCKPSEKIWV